MAQRLIFLSREFEGETTNEGPLSARHRRSRHGGLETRRARPSAATPTLNRLGKTLVLALVVIVATAPASASAAGGGTAANPAPQPAAPNAGPSTPTPDAVPGAVASAGSNASSGRASAGSTAAAGGAPRQSAPSITTSQAPASLAPGTAAASPAGGTPSQVAKSSRANRSALPSDRSHAARPRARSRHAPGTRTKGRTINGALAQLMAHAGQLLGFSGPAAVTAGTARRDGVLLLLSALGLLVLVGASSSLLRFLLRMKPESWEGR